jgi:hypothetical protein
MDMCKKCFPIGKLLDTLEKAKEKDRGFILQRLQEMKAGQCKKHQKRYNELTSRIEVTGVESKKIGVEWFDTANANAKGRGFSFDSAADKEIAFMVPQAYAGCLKKPTQTVHKIGTTGLGTCLGVIMWKQGCGVVIHFDSASNASAGDVFDTLRRRFDPTKIWVVHKLMSNVVKGITGEFKYCNAPEVMALYNVLDEIDDYSTTCKPDVTLGEAYGVLLDVHTGKVCELRKEQKVEHDLPDGYWYCDAVSGKLIAGGETDAIRELLLDEGVEVFE